ncbi:hypothetical protein ABWW58_09990 [Sporolactobacillus sp. STCC-11]|uniref:hypothetical protein n=1 Tax=Sporolactobacillus caesalpiniae TaxID=3230362 RepID=UPI003391E3AC
MTLITQAEYLTGSLHQWLDERGLSLPIINRVVVASAAQIQVTNLKSDRIKKIVRRANLKAELFTIDKQFSKAHLSTDTLNKVSAALLEAHQPLIIQPFRSLIKPEAIIKGVRCPDCGAMPMRKVKQHWHCAGCDHLSKTAHLLALLDYRLIHGPAITNKQCRDFLMMKSEFAARRLLHAQSSHFHGEKKSRVYYLSSGLEDKLMKRLIKNTKRSIKNSKCSIRRNSACPSNKTAITRRSAATASPNAKTK